MQINIHNNNDNIQEKIFMSDLAKRELNIKEVARSELDFSDLQPEGIFASMFSHKDDTDIRLFLVNKKII